MNSGMKFDNKLLTNFYLLNRFELLIQFQLLNLWIVYI